MAVTSKPPGWVNNRYTVLFIGNSFGVLKRVSFALQHRGYVVIWGDSGKAGLRIAEIEAPDLVISEIGLPDRSGFEVCRTVKTSFFHDTPVVLVGKVGDEEMDSVLAFKAGADDYFVSFTDWQFVLAKMEWLIRRKSAMSFDVDTNDPDLYDGVYASSGAGRLADEVPFE